MRVTVYVNPRVSNEHYGSDAGCDAGELQDYEAGFLAFASMFPIDLISEDGDVGAEVVASLTYLDGSVKVWRMHLLESFGDWKLWTDEWTGVGVTFAELALRMGRVARLA